MVRTVLLSIGCAAALTVSAQAADMPMKAPAPAYAPVMNWSGLYVGVNLGYASTRVDPGVGGPGTTDHLDGVFGGAQIGHNWQFVGSPLVLGIEADIQASGQDDSGAGFNHEIDWFGSVRGRLGYAMGSVMPYITAGWAFAHYDVNVAALGSGDTTADGWTIGGGVEWMFAPKWSLKAEYLYVDYGNESVTVAGITAKTDVDGHIGRIGINYHF